LNSRKTNVPKRWEKAVPGFVKIVSWTLLIYLVYCCVLFFMQRHILFPRHLVAADPAAQKDIPGVEKIWLNTNSGNIETWFIPAVAGRGAGPAPAVIFAHGNAELIDYGVEEMKVFSHLGVNVLLVEYPGYGRSEGKPSQKSITEALMAAYDILITRGDVNPAKIIFYGRSIGGGAICALAAERAPAALILMSTFTSVRSFALKHLVPGFLIRDPFDNLTVVAAYSGPVLIIHGKQDELIPYKHGLALYRTAKNGKLISYECGHNDCPPNWNSFWKEIESFLRQAEVIGNVTWRF
jgi:fermentation-respiration switch protein FrsA (DUF1100 family)